MKPVYVAITNADGELQWIKDPTTLVEGGFMLRFSCAGAEAAVDPTVFKPEARTREYSPVVQDELDGHGIKWSRPTKGRFCAQLVEGTVRELFLMGFKLAGPLPWPVAKKLQGELVTNQPVTIMHRFGG